MPVTHEPWLVALSIIVAIQGSFVGLGLAVQIADAGGFRRRVLLAAAAIALALAIWAMHFIGMLAARVGFPVDYLVVPTLLSFLVCVIVVGAGLIAASFGPLTPLRLAASATFMGSGIASMHYIGMTALHASAHMEHSLLFVAASVAVAIAASGLALWLAAGRGRRPSLFVSATALGLAISGMHYTAMAGLEVFPHATAPSPAPALSPDLLAIIVAIAAFLVSGVFLLFLVPDRSARPVAESAPAPRVEPAPATTPEPASAEPVRRTASHLPVEREGLTHYIAVGDIVAVQANAHYTTVFDGDGHFFCHLAIGEVEQRLDRQRFVRVHRSHIVNVERITGMKLAGDNGTIELAGRERHTVPVSRARLGAVKSRLRTAHEAFG